MGWTNELYNVYQQQCGVEHGDGKLLLPVSHSTANAQVEVTLTADGTFKSARALSKEEGLNTIIPVTEDSGGRTSGIAPMPLADKLIYLCGDYSEYVEKDNSQYYSSYIRQLKSWRDSLHSHRAVRAIYDYLLQGRLMKDLVENHVLKINEDTGMLDITASIANIKQTDVFVRFRVYGEGDERVETWLDNSLYDSFIAWSNEKMTDIGLCYATGETEPITYKHPSKIRNTGDKAKLISANDESGFTYRGRFADKTEALSLSYDFSQKMHNALRWLIARQGIDIGGLNLVVWTSSMQDAPKLMSAAIDEDDDEYFADDNIPDTEPKYRELLKKSIFGTRDFDINSKVMLMGVDAATTGRLAISIYEELEYSRLLENLEKWHSDTAAMRYYQKSHTRCINSFAIREIIECAYGTENAKGFLEAKAEVIKENFLRLLPCITQGRAIPADIVQNLVKKASNPLAYEKVYLHRKVIETACGMIRKENIDRKRGITAMAYDPNEKDRSYLYGCLLAIADAAERATYEGDDKSSRVTNAKRYWSMFAKRPCSTWKIIEDKVRVYMTKDGAAGVRYEKMFNEVMAKFDMAAFNDDSPLASAYLLGYHHYYNAEIYKKSPKTEEE